MTTFKITQYCRECDGYGKVADRNPINPGHSLVDCEECDGTGDIAHQEEYDSITDAQNDYPRARFTYVQSPIR